MPAFNDATCPKCGTQFSWRGALIDKPPCPNPKCDYKPVKEKIEKVLVCDICGWENAHFCAGCGKHFCSQHSTNLKHTLRDAKTGGYLGEMWKIVCEDCLDKPLREILKGCDQSGQKMSADARYYHEILP
jgi:hypothetical protein